MSFNIDRLSEVGLSTTDACMFDYVLDRFQDSSESVLCVLKNAEQLHCVASEFERQRGVTSFLFDEGRIGFTAISFIERNVFITRNPPSRGEIWWVTPSWFSESRRGQKFYRMYCLGGAELTAESLIKARTIVKDGDIAQGGYISESAAYITEMEENLRKMLEVASIQRKSESTSSPPIETEYVVSEELMNFIDSFKVI